MAKDREQLNSISAQDGLHISRLQFGKIAAGIHGYQSGFSLIL